jgi:hypothetical protein
MGNTPSAEATVAITTPSAGYLAPEGSGTEDGEGTATLFARAREWEQRRTVNDAKEVAVLGGQLLARYEGRLPDDWERSSDLGALQALRVDPYATTMCEILRTAGSKHGPRAELLSTVGAEPACCSHDSLQRWRRYAAKAEEATAAARTGVQRGHVALRDGPGVAAAGHALLLLRCAPNPETLTTFARPMVQLSRSRTTSALTEPPPTQPHFTPLHTPAPPLSLTRLNPERSYGPLLLRAHGKLHVARSAVR